MASLDEVLEKLDKFDQLATLALVIGGKVIPLVYGTIRAVRTLASGPDETVEFAVIIRAGKQKLEEVRAMKKEDLEAINAEFARLGIPLLDIPE